MHAFLGRGASCESGKRFLSLFPGPTWSRTIRFLLLDFFPSLTPCRVPTPPWVHIYSPRALAGPRTCRQTLDSVVGAGHAGKGELWEGGVRFRRSSKQGQSWTSGHGSGPGRSDERGESSDTLEIAMRERKIDGSPGTASIVRRNAQAARGTGSLINLAMDG